MKLIGRKAEIQQLQDAYDSPNAELISIYGRRRVGKTFLVKEFFKDNFDFYATGIYQGLQQDEIEAFIDPLKTQGIVSPGSISSWMEAFTALRDYLKKQRKRKLVIFLDELPWFDVPPGQFLKAFEWFWNSWASTRDGLKLIVCGSATTWMLDKFIGNKGGLHNRTTVRIHLSPFDLPQTAALLQSKGIEWDPQSILEAYMVMGGVPYYLSLLNRNLSLPANIDNLFFRQDAPLKNEYELIFRSLFRDSEYYMKIIDAVAMRNAGTTRKEIFTLAKITNNGTLTRALKNLVECDFLRKYNGFGKKERDAIYQLTDLATLFHKRFVEGNNDKDEKFWTHTASSPKGRAWSGIAFEQVCLLHLSSIKKALGIDGVKTEASSWRFHGNENYHGCQIDLVISRADKVINLCEMKYSSLAYSISPKYAAELLDRKSIFKNVTQTHDAIHLTLITPYGLLKNANTGVVNQTLTLSDLFY